MTLSDEEVVRELITALDQVALQLRLVRAALENRRPQARRAPRDPPEAREFLPYHPPRKEA